jgi:hypothetical protein
MTIIINKQEELEALIDKKNNDYKITINDDLEINCDIKFTFNNDLISDIVADNITVYGNIVADDIIVYDGNIGTERCCKVRHFNHMITRDLVNDNVIRFIFKAKNIIINGNLKAYIININNTIEHIK